MSVADFYAAKHHEATVADPYTDAFGRYYGDSVLQQLQALAHVERHTGPQPLHGDVLIERARECEVVVSDRATPGEVALFAQSPDLMAFVRCAVDIRTVDVDAASANGVLVTPARGS
ncbi:MAG: D-3-phosphoglycerate dehydrogenase [Gammaproteobacteria bacterium]